MPYTLGASGADDINVSIGVNLMASGVFQLVTGWWYPTAVGTDVLWSAGNVACVQMASSTLINLTTDNATTGGVWQGTFTALANNTWNFLAFLANFTDTGPAGAVRMWQGAIDTAPVEVSVTQTTAPVGVFAGSQAFTIGNKGTSASLAFNGDIGNVTVQQESGSGLPLTPATVGTWTQAEADKLARSYVIPAWLGDYAKIAEGARTLSNQRPALFYELDNGNTLGWGRVNSGLSTQVVTVNGATKTITTRNPRPPISRPGWPLRRR